MNSVAQDFFQGPNQEYLVKLLKCLFSGDEVVVESRKQSSLKYETGGYVELDIWLPKYELCFEFQDSYHYVATWYSHKRLNEVRHKDDYKKNAVHTMGMSLVDVPCWWDGTLEKLVASIQFCRPDIFSSDPSSELISLNPPESQFTVATLENVGELMLASFPITKIFAESEASSW
eukprot:Phypoly_transcript_17046.p1 GENE.Phypoly_transcript_17046~~Phypoly_transcript_17046.p1  ORF type:complete len:175 (+),score=13.61 Phypoly_transcript_17046:15-539(+)